MIKVKDIDVESCANYETISKQFKEHFGSHFQNVLFDFKQTNMKFVEDACNNPDCADVDNIEQALLNYFIYYCFGVSNTLDPKSCFNEDFISAKTDSIIEDIESKVKAIDCEQ